MTIWPDHVPPPRRRKFETKDGTFACESAEVAAEIQTKFCGDREKNYSNSVIRQTIAKSADETTWP